MTFEEFYAELEEDIAWRQAEVRTLQNLISGLDDEARRSQHRRAVVLLLYAHVEGFCRFALLHYVRALNNMAITCREAHYAIAAASLSDVFWALRDPYRKCREFRDELPDDSALHRFARDREFVERTDEIGSRLVAIPDSVVDLESNIKPAVLRKNLYRLGLPHEKHHVFDATLNRLIAIRNSIGHGETRRGIAQSEYEDFRNAAFGIMETMTRQVADALRTKQYLRVG